MPSLDLPIRAAVETAAAHGISSDRCDILQNGSTLVLRLTDTLVARVVQDRDGPRRGSEWFARENAVAAHLSRLGAPVIPLHPSLPPGPHEHLGFSLNFWLFVTTIELPPDPAEIGRTLHHCHAALSSFPQPLPHLAILSESLDILHQFAPFPLPVLDLLQSHLSASLAALNSAPCQPLHGDAHLGNLLNSSSGLLWTDWEDAFSGPVEWDLASAVWNARFLDADSATADAILSAYSRAGGSFDPAILDQCLVARAAVMSAWYPLLYPDPSPERQNKLQHRLDWLRAIPPRRARQLSNLTH